MLELNNIFLNLEKGPFRRSITVFLKYFEYLAFKKILKNQRMYVWQKIARES